MTFNDLFTYRYNSNGNLECRVHDQIISPSELIEIKLGSIKLEIVGNWDLNTCSAGWIYFIQNGVIHRNAGLGGY